jgi:hypothetical protein
MGTVYKGNMILLKCSPSPFMLNSPEKFRKNMMDSMGINNDGTIEWECLIWTRDGIELFDPPRIGGRKAT